MYSQMTWENQTFKLCQATNFSRFLATGGLGSSAYDNQTCWKKVSFAVGFLEIQEHEAKKAFEAGWVQFHVCSTWHNHHDMGVWCSRCFQRVPIPRSQKIQKKHFTGFDSGDSGNAWVLPCFCLVFLWFSMLEMLWIPTSRLGSSSKVSFSEHNLASLLQTTCSLPDGWRLISQI